MLTFTFLCLNYQKVNVEVVLPFPLWAELNIIKFCFSELMSLFCSPLNLLCAIYMSMVKNYSQLLIL